MSIRDWVTVIPAASDVKETARALLALAHDPQDVRTRGNGSEFLVAPYVADLYTSPPKRRRSPAKKEEGEE